MAHTIKITEEFSASFLTTRFFLWIDGSCKESFATIGEAEKKFDEVVLIMGNTKEPKVIKEITIE